jgi:O-antigen biosynthesis alpha-1,2-mannosyltransferase
MRLGVMLRHFDQHEGGVKVYTRELMNAIVADNTRHEIVMLYRNRRRLGTYSGIDGVSEVLLEVKVPGAVRRLGIDVLFNPKYSIPLNVRCRTAWVCHGLDWYVMPRASRWVDRLNHRLLIPQYAAKSDAVIAVSETTREHVMKYLDVPGERVHTIYSGLTDVFHRPVADAQLAEARRRFRLPPRFLLYCGAVYPPKNFTRLIQAYAKVGPARGVPLVIAGGSNRFLSEHELHEPQRQHIADWVHWLGWLDNGDLPAIYRLAQGLLLPSLYESVGMPVMEAMACGCPTLTANRYGTRELAEGAAVLVNPESVDEIAAGIVRLLEDQQLRAELQLAGRERAERFTWQRTAAEVMGVLESLPRTRSTAHDSDEAAAAMSV